MKLTKKDIYYLSLIYTGILSERQNKTAYHRMVEAKNTFIKGTMPFGQHFYYNNENVLTESDFDVIKDVKLLTEVFVIYARRILTIEGVRK